MAFISESGKLGFIFVFFIIANRIVRSLRVFGLGDSRAEQICSIDLPSGTERVVRSASLPDRTVESYRRPTGNQFVDLFGRFLRIRVRILFLLLRGKRKDLHFEPPMKLRDLLGLCDLGWGPPAEQLKVHTSDS